MDPTPTSCSGASQPQAHVNLNSRRTQQQDSLSDSNDFGFSLDYDYHNPQLPTPDYSDSVLPSPVPGTQLSLPHSLRSSNVANGLPLPNELLFYIFRLALSFIERFEQRETEFKIQKGYSGRMRITCKRWKEIVDPLWMENIFLGANLKQVEKFRTWLEEHDKVKAEYGERLLELGSGTSRRRADLIRSVIITDDAKYDPRNNRKQPKDLDLEAVPASSSSSNTPHPLPSSRIERQVQALVQQTRQTQVQLLGLQSSPPLHIQISDLLNSFPNLETLSINYIWYCIPFENETHPYQARRITFPNFPNVNINPIRPFELPSSSSSEFIIGIGSKLRSLEIQHGLWLGNLLSMFPNILQMSSLKKLSLKWIGPSGDPPIPISSSETRGGGGSDPSILLHLEELSLIEISLTPFQPIRELLNSSRTSLKSLHLQPKPVHNKDYTSSNILQLISLFSPHNLNRLELKFNTPVRKVCPFPVMRNLETLVVVQEKAGGVMGPGATMGYGNGNERIMTEVGRVITGRPHPHLPRVMAMVDIDSEGRPPTRDVQPKEEEPDQQPPSKLKQVTLIGIGYHASSDGQSTSVDPPPPLGDPFSLDDPSPNPSPSSSSTPLFFSLPKPTNFTLLFQPPSLDHHHQPIPSPFGAPHSTLWDRPIIKSLLSNWSDSLRYLEIDLPCLHLPVGYDALRLRAVALARGSAYWRQRLLQHRQRMDATSINQGQQPEEEEEDSPSHEPPFILPELRSLITLKLNFHQLDPNRDKNCVAILKQIAPLSSSSGSQSSSQATSTHDRNGHGNGTGGSWNDDDDSNSMGESLHSFRRMDLPSLKQLILTGFKAIKIETYRRLFFPILRSPFAVLDKDNDKESGDETNNNERTYEDEIGASSNTNRSFNDNNNGILVWDFRFFSTDREEEERGIQMFKDHLDGFNDLRLELESAIERDKRLLARSDNNNRMRRLDILSSSSHLPLLVRFSLSSSSPSYHSAKVPREEPEQQVPATKSERLYPAEDIESFQALWEEFEILKRGFERRGVRCLKGREGLNGEFWKDGDELGRWEGEWLERRVRG